MLLHLESLRDCAVLHSVGDEMNHLLLAVCQHPCPVSVLELEGVRVRQPANLSALCGQLQCDLRRARRCNRYFYLDGAAVPSGGALNGVFEDFNAHEAPTDGGQSPGSGPVSDGGVR